MPRLRWISAKASASRKKVSFEDEAAVAAESRRRAGSLGSATSSRSSSFSSINELRGPSAAYSSSETTTFFSYALKSPEQWAADKNLSAPEVTKRYIKKCKLKKLIMGGTKRSSSFVKSQRLDKLQAQDLDAWRLSLLDLLKGLLHYDPEMRWTAWQTHHHPLLTHMPCPEPFEPPQDSCLIDSASTSSTAASAGSGSRSAIIQIPGAGISAKGKNSPASSSHSSRHIYGSSVDSAASVSFSVSPPNRPLQPGPFGSFPARPCTAMAADSCTEAARDRFLLQGKRASVRKTSTRRRSL